MKLDQETKDAMRWLIADGYFIRRTVSLDISKFLDENNKLDLWLLEVAIRNSVRFVYHALRNSMNYFPRLPVGISGTSEYLDIRNVSGKEKAMEEYEFIFNFFKNITLDELSQ